MKAYKDSVGKVYLYLFSMLGLVLVVIGSVGLINLGLKTWVFEVSDPWAMQPPTPMWSKNVECLNSCENLSEEQLVLMDNWLEDYERWNQTYAGKQSNYRNNESAASNLALLLVGIPLFLFHWKLLRKTDA